MDLAKRNCIRAEGERAARRLAEMIRNRELSYWDFLQQSGKLVPEALSSVGISEDLSNQAKAQIALLAWEMNKEEYSGAEVDEILESFKG